jgi:hypothetical protein
VNLAEYQRALVRLSFVGEANEQDFAGFPQPERFVMYRAMVRSRLLGMTKQAFRKTLELVGEAAFDASFIRYLEQRPPSSPLIRDVIAAFGPFARGDQALVFEGPPCLCDLLSFEEAKWRVAYRKNEVGTLREFDFAGIPVLNPALEVLHVRHRVHELEGGQCLPEAGTLLVYRPPHDDDLRWYMPDALLATLLRRALAEPRLSLAEHVRNAAQSLGKALDESLLEELASGVTLALQRGVLLGSA